MTDRRAAETVGLNPDSAAYTKAKPRVRAHMLEHRAAVQQQLVQQEVDLSRLSRHAVEPAVEPAVEHAVEHAVERAVEGPAPPEPGSRTIPARLWEIANLSPDMTRGSITGQVKALAMIVAMQNFIPDRLAADRLSVSTENKPAPAPAHPQIYASAWRRGQQNTTIDPQPNPALPSKKTRRKIRPPSPSPSSLPARWEIRLRPPVPASPPLATALPPRVLLRSRSRLRR